MDLNEKWINNYIDNIDLSKIEWIKFDGEQLMTFYQENYLDEDVWQYVFSRVNSPYVSPIGLHYLSFDYSNNNYSFLLGIVDNYIGKKTIVSAMIYFEKYYMFENQSIPLTYISSVETNSYFWNKGIYKRLCEVVINFINSEQHILISEESDMGKRYHVVKKLEETLVKNGFKKRILVDDYLNDINLKVYDMVCGKKRTLK